MKPCERCDEPIADDATQCRCGWKRNMPNAFNPTGERSPARYVEHKCATATCYVPAMPGHQLCEYHYIKPHQDAAEAYCESLGLDTVAKQRQYFREQAKRVHKPFPDDPEGDTRETARQVAHGTVSASRTAPDREPGSDC